MCGTERTVSADRSIVEAVPEQHDDVATLLMVARTEIRNLMREAADLPAEEAAEILEMIEHLNKETRRIGRAAARVIRDH